MNSVSNPCSMVKQGFPAGSCLVQTSSLEKGRACDLTLRINEEGGYERVIKSIHLSRPEDYLSIYQSGCNHTCKKCHSHEFSKHVNGDWMSSDDIANKAIEYARHVTVYEPKERATSWHAQQLCKHCGSCVLTGEYSPKCPRKLKKEQIVLSPQGFGPARNIIAFTGGDIMCKPEFYTQTAEKIKAEEENLLILLETNGYGLTPKNLEKFASAGIDSFWLDIKAYSESIYQNLCGTTNKHILESVQNIKDLGFTLEILTLFIPSIVETDEHKKIAKLIVDVDATIPTTLLAFFPCFELNSPLYRGPNVSEMAKSFEIMKEIGVKNLRMGNLGVFMKNQKDMDFLETKFGKNFY